MSLIGLFIRVGEVFFSYDLLEADDVHTSGQRTDSRVSIH